MTDSEKLLLTLVVTVLCAGAGAFLGSYLRRKGENLATHEDIDKLVRQMSAVTNATKEIEAKISGELWDRQKRWELKRDVLLAAATQTSRVKDELIKLWSFCNTERIALHNELPSRPEQSVKAKKSWVETINRLDESVVAAFLVCSEEMAYALRDFNIHVRQAAVKVIDGEPEAYLEEDVARWWQAVTQAMRKEITNDQSLK